MKEQVVWNMTKDILICCIFVFQCMVRKIVHNYLGVPIVESVNIDFEYWGFKTTKEWFVSMIVGQTDLDDCPYRCYIERWQPTNVKNHKLFHNNGLQKYPRLIKKQ